MNTQTKTKPAAMTNQIRAYAKEARLTGAVLEEHLQNANPENLNFFATYLKAEIASRRASKRRRLIATAHLPATKTLENYDWSKVVLPPGATKESLTNLDFLPNHEDLICWATSAAGKPTSLPR